MQGTQVTIVGNLTDDPELRFTASGAAVVKFDVAVNRRVFDRQANEWKDGTTDYHRVTAWRGLAENCVETLAKGARVIVVGDVKQRHWEDKETGQKRSAWELNAEAIGPDLTWATAKVTRKASTRGGTAPDDPWSTASKQRPASTAERAAAFSAAAGGPGTATTAGGYSDEPPF